MAEGEAEVGAWKLCYAREGRGKRGLVCTVREATRGRLFTSIPARHFLSYLK